MVEAVFLASGNEFSIEFYSFRRVETDFLVLFFIQRKFCASRNHYSNEGEPISYRVTFLPLLHPFSTHFVYIYLYKYIYINIYIYIYIYKYVYLLVQAVFRHSENIFLTNPSFQLVEAEFLFSGNCIL